MKQIVRNLTDPEDGFLKSKRYLIMDRDTKFCEAFREILNDEGVKPVRLPPRSPNLNANLERFFRSLKDECLSRMIFFGESSLRRATESFIRQYHEERNHQGLANRLIEPGDEVGQNTGEIECRERLGGILRYYYCALHKCKDDERSPRRATPTTHRAHHPRPVWLRLPFEITTFADQPVHS